jgi:ABC-type multidrug transport system permease subunit
MAPFSVDPNFLIKVGAVEALFAIPAGLVLKRTGHSIWWALLCFIPIAALIGLWVLALTRWTPPSSNTQ